MDDSCARLGKPASTSTGRPDERSTVYGMKWSSTAAVLLATVLWPAGNPAAAQKSSFIETFEVARAEWYRGEDVLLTFERCNSSNSPAIRCQTCFPEESVKIFANDGAFIARHVQEDRVCYPGEVCRTWEPGECSTQSYQWPQIKGSFPPLLPAIPDPASPGIYYGQIEFDGISIRTEEFQTHGSPRPIPMIGGTGIATLAVLLMMIGGYLSARRLKSRSPGQVI